MRCQLLGKGICNTFKRDLHKFEEGLAVVANRLLFHDFDDQPRFQLDHERHRVPARDDVGPIPAIDPGAAVCDR
jgi:hypothetical protein